MASRLALGVTLALAGAALSGCGAEQEAGPTTSGTTSSSTSVTSRTTPTTTQPTTTTPTTTNGGPSTSNQVSIGPAFGPGGESPIGFGTVPVGSSRVLEVTVKNESEVARTIVGITIGGENAAEFASTGGVCAVDTELDALGGACVLEVTFTPTVAGSRNALLIVSVNPKPGGFRRLHGGPPATRPPIHTVPPIETQPTKTG
jgi:hypothetical protein